MSNVNVIFLVSQTLPRQRASDDNRGTQAGTLLCSWLCLCYYYCLCSYYESGLMPGTSRTSFSPYNTSALRADLVTSFYRQWTGSERLIYVRSQNWEDRIRLYSWVFSLNPTQKKKKLKCHLNEKCLLLQNSFWRLMCFIRHFMCTLWVPGICAHLWKEVVMRVKEGKKNWNP